MLPANAQTRHLTSQFVESEGDAHPLLARHVTIAVKLKFQCGLRRHYKSG